MTPTEPVIRNVSDTAMWTAAYRADESDRADALFHDPLARRLAGERGFEIAKKAPFPVRYGVVLRTAVLDEVIMRTLHDDGPGAVLNLAAGLDARPYRLDLPESLLWVEADMPELMDYKESVIDGARPCCRLERERVDLADPDARREVFARVGSRADRVLVVTEGLLSYLDPAHVAELADDLHAQPSFAAWATDLNTTSAARGVRTAADRLSDGRAQSRFAPEEDTAFFAEHGWREREYHDLFTAAHRLGRDSILSAPIRLAMRLAPEGRRRRFERGFGVAVLERA